MSCTNPIPAFVYNPDPVTGKKKVKLLTGGKWSDFTYDRFVKYFENDPRGKFVSLPCGHCDSCFESSSKNWAIRCTLEAADHYDNCFLTLTYNDSSLPKEGVSKRDIRKFIKRLRNKYGEGIRYFGCSEYGSSLNTERAHYHIILFGFFPPDAKLVKPSPFGGNYFSSRELQALWRTDKKGADGKYHSLGFVSVGEVSYASCAYVARYVQKKLKRDLGIANKNPEFSFMSRRPGIGYNYFKNHCSSLMDTDRIYADINGTYLTNSCRYFDKLIERIDPDKLQELKQARIRYGIYNVADELLKRNLSSMESYLLEIEREKSEKFNKLRRRII